MIGPPPPVNWRERRHLQLRVDDDDADDQERDRADLQERAEIVARAEQHPDRQHRGDEAVGRHRDDDLLRDSSEPVRRATMRRRSCRATTASSMPTTPMIVASAIRPLRKRYM